MCLAQGHNTVMPVGLEPVAPRSQVKHSTTEPLRSPPPVSDAAHGCLLKYRVSDPQSFKNCAFWCINFKQVRCLNPSH